MSEDVGRLLDHLKVDKAHGVGYSMGAWVTNRFRVMHPDRLLSASVGGGGALNDDSLPVLEASARADAVARGDMGPFLLAPPPLDSHRGRRSRSMR